MRTKKNKKRRGGNNPAKEDIEKMLKIIETECPNLGACISLGPYGKDIKQQIFKDFTDFELITKDPQKIGVNSLNGYVVKIPFTVGKHTAYTVLKCSKHARSDNLFYEYLVGKYFINPFLKRLPCFVETYDLYEFAEDVEDYVVKSFAESPYVSTIVDRIEKMEIGLLNIDNLIKYSCIENKRLCLMMQYFDNFERFETMMSNNTKRRDYMFDTDIFNFLFQVYFALDHPMLRDRYTHYDLHLNNICAYKPFPEKQYVLMRYHYTKENKVIEFKTQFIAKIIDYGRNHINANKTLNTSNLIEKICKTPECDPNCGRDVGYHVISGSIAKQHMIDPTKLNRSIDLLAAKNAMDINEYTKHLPSTAPTPQILFKTTFGTPSDDTGNPKIGDIKSVSDFHIYLKDYVIDEYNKQMSNQKYNEDWTLAMTIDVYDDGRNYRVNGVADPDTELKFESKPEPEPESRIASKIAAAAVVGVMSAAAFFLWYAKTQEDDFKQGGGLITKHEPRIEYLNIAKEKFGPDLPPEVEEFAGLLNKMDKETLKQYVLNNLTATEKRKVVKIVREDFPGFDLKENDTVFGNLFERNSSGGSYKRKKKRTRSVKKQRKNAANRFRV